MNLRIPYKTVDFYQLSNYQILKKDSPPWSKLLKLHNGERHNIVLCAK
jgi:hypothetical protein